MAGRRRRAAGGRRPSCASGWTPKAACATGTSPATRPTSASRSRTRRASTSTSGWTRRSATWPASRPCARKAGIDFDAFLAPGSKRRAAPLHRQGHRQLPRPVLAGDAARRRLPRADPPARQRLPDGGRREDVASRAAPSSWRAPTSTPAWTRKRCATTSPPSPRGGVDDLDLNLADFVARVNADLVGKFVNLASRCAGFIEQALRRPAGRCAAGPGHVRALRRRAGARSRDAYERNDAASAIRQTMALADEANRYIDERKPWVHRQAGTAPTPNCRPCARRA